MEQQKDKNSENTVKNLKFLMLMILYKKIEISYACDSVQIEIEICKYVPWPYSIIVTKN